MSQLYSEAQKSFYTVPPAQGIYEESETAKAQLGYRLAMSDGRVYRYAKAGATALLCGKFCKAGGVSANYILNKAVSAAVTTGAASLTLTTGGALTTGAEGYLQVNDCEGQGTLMKIKETAANATTTTSTDVTLYDPLPIGLTTSSQATIVLNPYEQVEIVSAATDIVIGIPPINVTVEYYFWLQTWGIASVLSSGTPPAGYKVYVDATTTAGGTTTLADASAAASAPAAGVQILVGVDTEYKPVYLTICP